MQDKITEYTYNMVNKFMQLYPEFVKSMKASDHNELGEGILSNWHIEGDVWTHTMMVVSHIKTIISRNWLYGTSNWRVLILAALLHDIGKPLSRSVDKEKGKVHFLNHSGMSTLLATGIVRELADPTVSEVSVLRLISHHQLLTVGDTPLQDKAMDKIITMVEDTTLFNNLRILRRADCEGALPHKVNSLDSLNESVMYSKIANYRKPYTPKNDYPEMTILVGFPASGKSTYCASQGIEVLSRDEIVMELSNTDNYVEAFDTVDQFKVNEVREERFRALLQNRSSFIVDETNLSLRKRKQMIRQARKFSYQVKIVCFVVPLPILLQRNEERAGKTIPRKVYSSMAKNYSIPLPGEYDEILFLDEDGVPILG